MTPERDDRPEPTAIVPEDAPEAPSPLPHPESDHTFLCRVCGAHVDGHDLGSRLLHTRPAHRSGRVDRAQEQRISGQGGHG